MPPENAGYMVAGYVVTVIILVGYLLMLWGKGRKVLDRATPPAGTTAPR